MVHQRGGKRNGAGRKPSRDKKEQVILYVRGSIIRQFGGKGTLKDKFYGFVQQFD